MVEAHGGTVALEPGLEHARDLFDRGFSLAGEAQQGALRDIAPERHRQHKDLALCLRQLVEHSTQVPGQLGAQRSLLGPFGRVPGLGNVDIEVPLHTCGGQGGVDHLVRGDAVDERQERLRLIVVARQRAEHGEADLLGHIVGG